MSAIGFAEHRPLDEGEPLARVHGAFVASAAALGAWAMAAAPGRRCIYARVQRLPVGGVGRHARQLAAAGALQINQKRSRVDSMLFEFMATRTARPITAALLDESRLPVPTRELLDLLAKVARNGSPCPTNAQLAGALGIGSVRVVQERLRQLVDAGLIRVECQRTGNDGLRTIEHVESGHRTAVSA